MKDEEFQRRLADLVQEIGALPKSEQAKLESLADETVRRHKELKESYGAIQESLDFLRLSIKYILFDLEATRRENQYLRKMLERLDDEGDLS